MIDEREVLGRDEVAKLALAVVRGLKEPFTTEEAVAETEKAHRWALGVRIETALLEGVLTGRLGVKFKDPDPEPKFFRLAAANESPTPAAPETCPHGGVVSENHGAKMCASFHNTLMHDADVLIEEKLETGEPASDSWLVDKMRERHPEEPADRIRFVVNAAFKARRAGELAGKSPAELLAEAAELERYMDERGKNRSGVEGTEGNG